MGSTGDQIKGKAKEVTGTVIGDEDLEAEGAGRPARRKAKEKVEHAVDEVEGAARTSSTR